MMPPTKGVDMKNRTALLAATIALPFSMIACSDDKPANAVPDDVSSVVEAYTASWNDYDSDAFLAVVTDDYVFVNNGTETDDATQASFIGGGGLESMDWSADEVGDSIVAGDGPYYVATTNTLTTSGSPEGVEGLSTLTVVDDGGELKVSEHTYVGENP
jgi:hypothetical protein